MPLWKHKAYNLTEDEIRYAMSMTRSNAEAARFLRVNQKTYMRYASMYVDAETGKTLYDLHSNKVGVGIPKGASEFRGVAGVQAIIEGKHPNYSPKKLKRRLIAEGFKAERCEFCGFEERRVNDYTVPLILVWKDGDKTNHKLDNLQLLCYNCYYLTHSDLFNRRVDRTDFGGY